MQHYAPRGGKCRWADLGSIHDQPAAAIAAADPAGRPAGTGPISGGGGAPLDRADDSYRDRANSLDTKAGLVLSAAGVVVALVGTAASVAGLTAQILAIAAGGASVATILPRVDNAVSPRHLSNRYLQSDETATRVLLVNTRLDVQEANERHLFRKAPRLKTAIWLLLASAGSIGVGGIVDQVSR